jgi:hypothetical protein
VSPVGVIIAIYLVLLADATKESIIFSQANLQDNKAYATASAFSKIASSHLWNFKNIYVQFHGLSPTHL